MLQFTVAVLQNVCPKAKATIMGGGKGGFAERFRGSGNLAVKIPNTMKPADAAPLLCAGITVWSPIAKYVTKPGMKVCFAFCIISPHVTMVVVPLRRSGHPLPNNTSFNMKVHIAL